MKNLKKKIFIAGMYITVPFILLTVIFYLHEQDKIKLGVVGKVLYFFIRIIFPIALLILLFYLLPEGESSTLEEFLKPPK